MGLVSTLTFGIKDRLEWLNTLSKHAGVGVWDAVIHDGDAAHPKSRWTWSAEFRRLCGYTSKADFPDKMTSWSDLLHPDDIAPTFAAFGETIKTGVSYDICYRLKTRNGSFRWFQATGGVVKDYRGRVRRACGSLIDIHEAKTQELEQREAVAALIGHIRSLATGDLLNPIPDGFPARFADLKTDFNKALANLNDSMQAVAGISNSVSEGAASIRAASNDLSARTEQQAASLEETAAAMDEITSTVRQTADGASRANSIVCTTRAEAEQSGEVVRNAVEAMKGIEQTSSEISNIIGVIDGIAFQTNLLALNAGVEAARAGEAGRGFAVVASEVRALAQRSADAAKDVKTRILASGRQIEKGVKLVGETGDALQCIIGRIGEISQLVSEIAASSEQQASGLRQVNNAVSEMDGVTQQNAAMVEETTAAASNLADEANTLRQEVGRFKLEREVSLRSRAKTDSGRQPIQKKAATTRRSIDTRTAKPPLAVVGDDWSRF